jgi:hypothetical protein
MPRTSLPWNIGCAACPSDRAATATPSSRVRACVSVCQAGAAARELGPRRDRQGFAVRGTAFAPSCVHEARRRDAPISGTGMLVARSLW